MTTDKATNFCMVKIRAQDLAEAAILRHWVRDDDYHAERYAKAETQLLAAIFADLPALVSRVEGTISAVHETDMSLIDVALAIACDLIGKDLDEALRERRKAEAAA